MRGRNVARSSYIDDYGGPLVQWPGPANQDPDWAALFPIPECYQPKEPEPSRPSRKRSRRGAKKEATPPPAPADADEEADDEEEYDGEFWLSPRMAAQLWRAGTLYVDIHCDADIFSDDYWEDLPAVVEPYAKQADWWDAYRQAAMRIVARLAKGLLPEPNCTAEEMALHKIIEQARDEWEHDDCQDGLVQDLIDPLPACLPSSHTNFDEDFDAVSDVAFQDHDVLMLYDMPHLAERYNPVAAFMDVANLHPADWFKPFRPERVNDHVL